MKWRVRPTRCNNCGLLIIYYLNTFRPSLCPSSGTVNRTLVHMVFSTWCAGWCLGKLGRRLCALCSGCYSNNIQPSFPASQDTSQHIECWKPYALIYGLALLKMGIMMPETRWSNGLLINHNCCFYRVSIKSFPDYKHLLQKNYSTWKTNLFFFKM